MALSANTIWEVESGASDSNGGGFVTGATGTDWSKQTAAQYALTTVTTAAANAICLSASAVADMVGNICQITGGTNFITGFYQIISVSAGVSFTVDRNCTTAAGALGIINIGGALTTIQAGLNVLTSDQILYVKAATYSISAVLTLPSLTPSNYFTRIIGYSSVRGDMGQPTILQTTAANGININQNAISFQNFIMDGSSGTGLIGLNVTVPYGSSVNIKAINWVTNGILSTNAAGHTIYKCEVSGTTTGYGISISSGSAVSYCYIHDNSGLGGILFGGNGSGGTFIGNIVSNNTNFGMKFQEYFSVITNNLFYGNGSDGISGVQSVQFSIPTIVTNNIFAKNGGYGLNNVNNSANSGNSYPWAQNNGFWSNTSGATNHFTLDTTNIQISGSDPTNDPFVDKTNKNWALNNTSGAGILLRATGLIGILPGVNTSVGYQDIGTYQHQDLSGNTTYLFPIFD